MVTCVIMHRRHNAAPPGCHQDKVLWDVRRTSRSTRNLRERFPCTNNLTFQMPDVRGGITSNSRSNCQISYCPGHKKIINVPNGLGRLNHRDGEAGLRASDHGHLCFWDVD